MLCIWKEAFCFHGIVPDLPPPFIFVTLKPWPQYVTTSSTSRSAFLLFSFYPSYKQTHSLLCNGIEGLAFHTKPSSFREHMQAHAESRPHKSPLPIKSAPCHHPFHWSFHIPKTGKITDTESRISWFTLKYRMVYNVIGRILVIAPIWFVKTASWKIELACCPRLQHKNCDNAADGKHT